MAGMSIGDLARKTDVKVANIRFYEESGLLPLPSRREGGHRQYGREDVQRVSFIRTCRELGYSLEQIKALLRLAHPDNLRCTEAQELSRAQLGIVRERIAALQLIENKLTRHLEACEVTCCDGRAPACPILPAMPD